MYGNLWFNTKPNPRFLNFWLIFLSYFERKRKNTMNYILPMKRDKILDFFLVKYFEVDDWKKKKKEE